jgi:hypothetical protein
MDTGSVKLTDTILTNASYPISGCLAMGEGVLKYLDKANLVNGRVRPLGCAGIYISDFRYVDDGAG